MKEKKKVHYVKGVFVCPQCRQSYVQEKWIEEWRGRRPQSDYFGPFCPPSGGEKNAAKRRRAPHGFGRPLSRPGVGGGGVSFSPPPPPPPATPPPPPPPAL